jgi:hypothetical protein
VEKKRIQKLLSPKNIAFKVFVLLQNCILSDKKRMATILIHIPLATSLMNVSGHQKKVLKEVTAIQKQTILIQNAMQKWLENSGVFQTSFKQTGMLLNGNICFLSFWTHSCHPGI